MFSYLFLFVSTFSYFLNVFKLFSVLEGNWISNFEYFLLCLIIFVYFLIASIICYNLVLFILILIYYLLTLFIIIYYFLFFQVWLWSLLIRLPVLIEDIYTYTYHSYVLAATAAKRDSPQCAGYGFLPFTASTATGRLRGLENPAEPIGRCDSGGGFSGGKRSTDRPLWCWRHKKSHGTINGDPFYEHISNGDRRYS